MKASKRHAFFRYLAFVKPYRWTVVAVIVLGVGKFALPLIPATIYKHIVDRVIWNLPGWSDARRVELLAWLAAGLVGVTVVGSIVQYVGGMLMIRLSTSMTFGVRRHMWRHLQRLSLGFHQSRPTGSLLSRLMSDITEGQRLLSGGIINVFVDLGAGSIALVALMLISWKLTLLVLAVLPIYGVLYRKVNPRIRRASHAVREQAAVMSGVAVERLNGVALVQSFAQEPEETRHFSEQAGELRDRTVRRGKLSISLNTVSQFVVEIGTRAIWVVGALMAVRGEITPGDIIRFVAVAGMLYRPIRRLSEINVQFQTSMAAIERIFGILDVVPEVRGPRKADPDLAPSAGRVEFDKVSFSYDEESGNVLQDVSFTIEPGRRVAVVGESGAGKSTLVTLIPRLYDMKAGAIRIDGVDVREYDLKRLRRSIGIVLQDTILFSGTVVENLRYGWKDAGMQEVIAAAKAANAHEFVSELPAGYETVIGERGMTLSGGQRQRISLARTILQDPKILILDEATSSLDSGSENLIAEAFERVMAGRTSLIIAHRLSTVVGADRILVLKEGRLVESGPHTELLARGDHYSYLFDQQFGALAALSGTGGGSLTGWPVDSPGSRF